jgi:predicted RecB family nuclease
VSFLLWGDSIVTTKITKDVLEAYLHCKLKGHLKLSGQSGVTADFEVVQSEARQAVRANAIAAIQANHGRNDVLFGVRLAVGALRSGPRFVFDATFENDLFSLVWDGLKRVDGPSNLGRFHYIPMLFHEGHKATRAHRLQLEIANRLLGMLQGRPAANAIVWRQSGIQSRIRLNGDSRVVDRLSRELKETAALETVPTLVLNDHCQMCEFQRLCRDRAIKEENLSLIGGLGPKAIAKYARKGVLTLTQLAHIFRPRRRGRQAAPTRTRYAALQAMALRDKKTYVLGAPELVVKPTVIYLDVESTAIDGYVYLIGALVVSNGVEAQFSFWANDSSEEQKILDEFLDLLVSQGDFSLCCYGSYELAFLRRMRPRTARTALLDAALSSTVNVLSVLYPHVYFPTFTNGLKEIAQFLGCRWTDPGASGIQSVVWRSRWTASGNDEWKQRLITYNAEDCAALQAVTQQIFAIAAGTDHSCRAGQDGRRTPVTRIPDDTPSAFDWSFGTVSFVHPDFEHINRCAYFDYQRDRVYVHGQAGRSRQSRKRKKQTRGKPRTTTTVDVLAGRCPVCNSADVSAAAGRVGHNCPVPRRKRAYDLHLVDTGILRKVIESRSVVFRCKNCQAAFVPEEHERLDKHFHGLKSWAMFLHVAHHQSLRTVRDLLMEFFGLRVQPCELHMIKGLMADLYRPTCGRLLDRIMRGKLLHIDETEVKLRSEKGYVWVFTNLEEVVYFYRPNREGGFLREMLKDFRGVLVTDFYSAYDGVDCPQQRCLVHLMRDMNQMLLSNPFDAELQSVTREFGVILRTIVETIEQKGLRRAAMRQHNRQVSAFFADIEKRFFRSDPAEAIRARLLKYRDKLFTFMQHDDVPWNNNNAENAIKRFAYYRERTDGLLRPGGLNDFLVLLSICQTCRYKGTSFLKFLSSRADDFDYACTRKKPRQRRSSALQMYPKGFTPPHYRARDAARLIARVIRGSQQNRTREPGDS